LVGGGHEPQILGAHDASLCESPCIFHRHHEDQRRKCPNSLDLAQVLGLVWVVLFGDRLQLSVVVADMLCQRAYLLQDGPESRYERLGDVP
jgi:hypothetical protein